ncbi:RDD family protein [Streptomyces sp. NPDC090106]|uniref:RDD family protein n=1 Tax=Streptomyces sp. NPDC090106 TaxID=3365946 RepID=UPI003804352D
MSAPTPAPGDDRPREGYYPDPSIPGYVRYWNGVSWVPGTSRPAPSDGASPAPPAAPAAQVEETGPHFFDEDPPGAGPEPSSAWGADTARQTGFGGEQDRRISWGAAPGADPRVPSGPADGDGPPSAPPAEGAADAGGTFVFRRPVSGAPAAPAAPTGPGRDEGTMTFRTTPPRTPQQGGAQGGGTPGAHQAPSGPGFAAGKAAAERAAAQAQAAQAQAAQVQAAQAAQDRPQVPPQAQVQAPPQATAGAAPGVPQQPTPLSSGAGGGQPSWAQQVHRLAGAEDQPVTPWKPPVEDFFQAAARRQAEARPAGIGKRLAARLLDTVVVLGITAGAAVPLGTRAVDHVSAKIDAAKLSGETVTVWLLDGTTGGYLGIVLAVLLIAGVLYEALPTARWGRTLGKKLLGLQVRDIEGHEPPSFGAALRRWLVYSVPGLLVIGVVGVVWGLFDKPWRQCWHDKAAHTFVAG